MPLTWVNLTAGPPIVADFLSTNGSGSPICVDVLAQQAYFLDTGNVIKPISGSTQVLAFGNPKITAYSRPDAVTMAQDLSYMKGWAQNQGVTGGAGKPVYWVTRNSDDPNAKGSLRYAVNAAIAGGGGQIIFDPRDELDILLISRLNIPSNTTIDAPGRNVRIRTWSDTAIFNYANATNVIMRRLELGQLINISGINNKLNPGDPGYNADWGGPADQADGVTVTPVNCNKLWFDQMTINHVSDGSIDVASSLLTNISGGPCYYSISRSIFRGQYKTMLSGSSSIAGGDVLYTNTRKVFGTYYENWYDHCAERHPRAAALAYIDSVNNIFDLVQLETDDGIATGSYGIASLYGAWAQTRGDLFRTLDNVASLAVQTSDGTSIPESATINVNSVVEGALTIQTRNTGTPTALPYAFVPQTVPSDQIARNAWRKLICSAAGARREALPPGDFTFRNTSIRPLNGITVRARDDGNTSGRYELDSRQDNIVAIPEASNLTAEGLVGIAVRGNANVVLTAFTDKITQQFTTALTADRNITLSTTVAFEGNRFKIVRPATGAFNLNVGTGPLKALAVGTWCEVEYDGTAWQLIANGSL